MKILVSQHDGYNYQDASICQGLNILGHDVYSFNPGTNYVEKPNPRMPVDLFIQFIAGGEPLAGVKSIMVWGEDHHEGLAKVFKLGFDQVFVRDHIPGQPGIPMNFAIEERYYCVTDNGIKPISERQIDICFLGQLPYANRAQYVKHLKKDFGHLNLMLGPRKFNTPDERWTRWTRPWCAHDPAYFETLANSKIVLSFKGVGIGDCGRHWEAIASGGIPIIESHGDVDIVKPTPAGVRWVDGYEQLRKAINESLTKIGTPGFQEEQDFNWRWNRENHSTAARARYLLRECGF